MQTGLRMMAFKKIRPYVVTGIIFILFMSHWRVDHYHGQSLLDNKYKINNLINPKNEEYKSSNRTAITSKILKEKSTFINMSQFKTFSGAEIDGEMIVDRNNNLIINQKLNDWFLSIYTLEGEINNDEIASIINSYIIKLPSPGKEQAQNVFQSYQDYFENINTLSSELIYDSNDNMTENILRNRDEKRRIRRVIFSDDTAEALFGWSEKIEDQYLWKIPSFKRELRIRGELPPSTIIEESITVMNKAAVDSAQERNINKLSSYRFAWKSRIEKYNTFLNTLDQLDISEFDKDSAINEYQNEHFTKNEKNRLNAAVYLINNQQTNMGY